MILLVLVWYGLIPGGSGVGEDILNEFITEKHTNTHTHTHIYKDIGIKYQVSKLYSVLVITLQNT